MALSSIFNSSPTSWDLPQHLSHGWAQLRASGAHVSAVAELCISAGTAVSKVNPWIRICAGGVIGASVAAYLARHENGLAYGRRVALGAANGILAAGLTTYVLRPLVGAEVSLATVMLDGSLDGATSGLVDAVLMDRNAVDAVASVVMGLVFGAVLGAGFHLGLGALVRSCRFSPILAKADDIKNPTAETDPSSVPVASVSIPDALPPSPPPLRSSPFRITHIPESNFTIIGEGEIGDKVRELIEKAPKWIELGGYVPARVVISEDVLDHYLHAIGLPRLREADPALAREHIMKADISDAIWVPIKNVIRRAEEIPIVIRSSALGDAYGTGMYESHYAHTRDPVQSKHALRQVLASYFSPDAIAFRANTSTTGFGIMIEPMLGQPLGSDYFSPILSGFGVTSTAHGPGYTSIVPGLGGGVTSGCGEEVTRAKLKPWLGRLATYLRQEERLMYQWYTIPIRYSALLRNLDLITGENEAYAAKLFHLRENKAKKWFIERTGIMQDVLLRVDFLEFFDRVERMETHFGKSLYYEWAMTWENEVPKFWLVQAAQVNPRLEVFDNVEGALILNGYNVTGTGRRDCDAMVYCLTEKDVPRIARFNQGNGNYIVVYTSALKKGADEGQDVLKYHHISNAAAVLEWTNTGHRDSPISHWRGALESSQLFGVLDQRVMEYHEYAHIGQLDPGAVLDKEGLHIHRGPFSVIAEAARNRIEVIKRNVS